MADDPIRKLPSLVLVLIVPVVALLAIGLTQLLVDDGGSSSAVTPAGGDAIAIKDFTFVPETLTAAPGAKVVVSNRDQTAHTVTASDDSFDTGDLDGGGRATITAPTEVGTYAYICDIHQYMQGTLEVRR